MELAISNHDHELAIISADTLLKVVPNHVKATKTLIESGQIYSRLEKALKLVNEAISTKKDETGNCSFVFPQREVEKNKEQLSQERKKNNIKETQELLNRKGYNVGTPDGVMGKKTKEGLLAFCNKENIPPSEEINNTILIALREKAGLKKPLYPDPAEKKEYEDDFERVFSNVFLARQEVDKALTKDPYFPQALSLKESLEGVHTTLIFLKTISMENEAAEAIDLSSTFYDSSIEIMQACISAGKDVSTGWELASIFQPLYKKMVAHYKKSLNQTRQLFSTYKNGPALELAKSNIKFIDTVLNCCEALLEPTGSLMDYRRAGNTAINKFKISLNKVTSSIPGKTELSGSIIKFATFMKNYTIYNHNTTRNILATNKILEI